jgi:hypothetical protein
MRTALSKHFRIRLMGFVLAVVVVPCVVLAAEPRSFQFVDKWQLEVIDGYFWNDVSGALQFCQDETLRADFHDSYSRKKFGKSMASTSGVERRDLNSFIFFATGVGRGLELAPLTPAQKATICTDARKAAKAYISSSGRPGSK